MRALVSAAALTPLLLTVGVLIAATLPGRGYLLDLASHFAPHAVLLGVAGAALAVGLRRRRTGVITVLVAAVLLGFTLYRYDCWPRRTAEPDPSLTVRVIVYNAYARGAERRGSTLDDAFRAWAEEVDADVVCVVDPPWTIRRSGLWSEDQFPHVVERASEGRDFGITLLSRWPVRVTPLADSYEPRNRLSFAAHSSVVVVHPSGAEFLVTAAHPRSPRSRKTWELSQRWSRVDAELIRAWRLENATPVIFAGDFNTTPMGRLHGLIRRETGLRSPTRLFSQGTWPAWAPPQLALPIDRVWVSPGARITDAQVGPRVNSDHLPCVFEIQIPVHAEPASSAPSQNPQ